MYINPANAPTHEAMSLDEGQHLLIFGDRHRWQPSEQLQDLRAANYRTASQFADNKWMALNVLAMKQRHQPELAMAQVLDPDRSIHQHQRLSSGD